MTAASPNSSSRSRGAPGAALLGPVYDDPGVTLCEDDSTVSEANDAGFTPTVALLGGVW